jgi:hypothetical protein
MPLVALSEQSAANYCLRKAAKDREARIEKLSVVRPHVVTFVASPEMAEAEERLSEIRAGVTLAEKMDAWRTFAHKEE